MKKKLIIFDLDDTLVDTWGCITPHLIMQAIQSMVLEGLKIKSIGSAAKRLADLRYVNIGKKGFYNFNFEYGLKTLPGAAEMFEKTDAEFALVSKGETQAQMDKLTKAGISHMLFKKIIIVPTYNKKEYYQKMMEELGFDSDDCFACGDRYETDLLPAKELGMK